ncbi:MAG: hypothetical protein M5U28_11110 [Sandaracinaceae bacterium]|nr:hypothetical protein [Sandaracinaceae bacterium]
MVERARRMAPEAAGRVLEEASEVLGRDLVAHYRGDAGAQFATNRDVQVGVFVTNHVHLEALRERGVDAPISLGLSLGEYNHLVHAGALPFADALRLVDARGAAYDAGPRGRCSPSIPWTSRTSRRSPSVPAPTAWWEIVNLNSPTQNVLAGEHAAIAAAERILDEEGISQFARIDDRVPMHCSMFRPAADAFWPALERAPFRAPARPYLPNVLASFVHDAQPAVVRELLHAHVFSAVRWRESLELVAERHEGSIFVEVGPRDVLYGLLSRRWLKNARFKTDAPEEPERALDATLAEISRAA